MNIRKIVGGVAIPANILLIITIILNIMGILPTFWKTVYVFYIVLAIDTAYLALKLNRLPEHERSHSSIAYLSKYFFLLGLVVLAVNQFLKRQIINDYLPYIIGVIIALGFLTFFASRERVEKELDDEKTKEENAEQKRKSEFKDKYPRINRIPLLRGIVRWMYKEGWWYSVGLIAIVVLGFVLRIWNLGAVPFWYDELLHISQIQTINSLTELGNIHFTYTRTLPITFLALIGKLLFKATSEFTMRFPIVILSLISMPLVYLLTKRFISKRYSILASFFVCINPVCIIISQEVRYYVLLSILILLFYICLYSKINLKLKVVFLILLSYFCLDCSLIAFPFIIICIVFFFLDFKNKQEAFKFIKKNRNLIIFIVIVLVSFFIYKIPHIINNNYFNINDLFEFKIDFFTFVGIPLLILFILSILVLYFRSFNRLKHITLTILVFIFIFALVNTRFKDAVRYVTFLAPIIILISTVTIFSISKIYIKLSKIVFILVIILMILLQTSVYFTENNAFLTKQQVTWARPDYRAWSSLNISPEAIVISNVPHIAKYYVGRVDYSLDITSTSEFDPISKTPLIKDYAILNKSCSYIFSDYRTSYMWDKTIQDLVDKEFKIILVTRQTKVYESNYC
ncbi:MAG: hypothetical protein WC796_05810 [Candidatus Pacearchaeota archaeon]|jgi:hypothetical protein